MSTIKPSPAQRRYAQRQRTIAAMYSELRLYHHIAPAVKRTSDHFNISYAGACRVLGFYEPNIPGIVAAVEAL